MVEGNIHKDRWCGIILSQLKGQVWQDWVDHKENGDSTGYDVAKDMVLDLHGVSLMQCIKSTFKLRKDGETFGARATAAKVYINKLLKGTTTLAEATERLEMWLTLSSYRDECMGAVLREQPQNR